MFSSSSSLRFSLRAIAVFISCTSLLHVSGHSWVEELTLLSASGVPIGDPGYARGNSQSSSFFISNQACADLPSVLRTEPSFSDSEMVNLIPPNGRSGGPHILDTDKICKDSQSKSIQTDGSPRIKAAAGNTVALRYQENGHVTLPEHPSGKPKNRGTVYIYGTTDPQPHDTLSAIHKVWDVTGNGGDRRGKLLVTQDFDDGRCYQINNGVISKERQIQYPHVPDKLMGADLWCQNNITVPQEAALSKVYTLYWVWDWPTASGTPGVPTEKPEIYTTCMDIDIVDSADGEGFCHRARRKALR